MARYTDAVCRLCRREGTKLFLKGDRCYTREVRASSAAPIRRDSTVRAARASRTTASSCARSRRSSACTACSERQFRGTMDAASPHEGPRGREPARRCSSGGSTTSSSGSASRRRARRRASSCATATSSVNGRKADDPVVPREAGHARSRCARSRARSRASRRRSRRSSAAACRSGSRLDKEAFDGRRQGDADARRHHDADPRAADRRAVLAVASSIRSPTPRGSRGTPMQQELIAQELARADPTAPARERGGRVRRRATARFSCEPLERGFGVTLGNALRRVLLSSLQGAAITSVRIDGVLHEFSTIPGVHRRRRATSS